MGTPCPPPPSSATAGTCLVNQVGGTEQGRRHPPGLARFDVRRASPSGIKGPFGVSAPGGPAHLSCGTRAPGASERADRRNGVQPSVQPTRRTTVSELGQIWIGYGGRSVSTTGADGYGRWGGTLQGGGWGFKSPRLHQRLTAVLERRPGGGHEDKVAVLPRLPCRGRSAACRARRRFSVRSDMAGSGAVAEMPASWS